MEEWFIIQSFYHGLIRSAQEHIDAAARGSFFIISIEEGPKLIKKMTSNQSSDEERTQTRTHKVHQLEEVDMLTAKIDLLMKKLENSGLDHIKMVDAQVTCEECRETGHMGINCPTVSQDVNFIGNSNNGFILSKASMLGGTNPVSRLTTANKVVWGRTTTEVNLLSKILFGIS
jgi:hypothetical protein